MKGSAVQFSACTTLVYSNTDRSATAALTLGINGIESIIEKAEVMNVKHPWRVQDSATMVGGEEGLFIQRSTRLIRVSREDGALPK